MTALAADRETMPSAAERRKERISLGQCPNCGKEAAPYYLCGECRWRGKVNRMLARMVKCGGLKTTGAGAGKLFSLRDEAALDRMRCYADPKEDDARLRPRMKDIPVNVEASLIKLLTDAGRGCTLEEIYAAWGKLRANRSAPLVADMSKIIAAQRKREAKMAKRAALVSQGAPS